VKKIFVILILCITYQLYAYEGYMGNDKIEFQIQYDEYQCKAIYFNKNMEMPVFLTGNAYFTTIIPKAMLDIDYISQISICWKNSKEFNGIFKNR